jgi:cyclase
VTPVLREARLRQNVWIWTLGGDRIETSYGANCTAVTGRDSVLLVDPLIAPAYARLVETALRSKTSLPVRHVILTHHHTDHALGAGWFARDGVAVVAHRACRDSMAAEHPGLIEARRCTPAVAAIFADAEAYLPSVVFDDSLTIDLGGSSARAVHLGPGHTPGDSIVHLEKESLAICGDLVSVGYHVNYEDATVDNLERGLESLRSLGSRTYVPGHGAPGGAEILDDQSRYHRAASTAATADDLRSRYPDYVLEEVLPQSVRAWKRHAAS